MKVGSKRRRTKAQIQADEQEVLRNEMETQQKFEELEMLRQRIGQLEQQADTGKAASNILSKMIASGVAAQDEDSNVIVNAVGGNQKFEFG